MKVLKKAIVLLIIISTFSSCNRINKDCPPNAIIEWVDLVMINDVQYQSSFTEYKLTEKIEKGKLLGKVNYQLADKACVNHKVKNGDAAFLEEGTPIYEVKGYPTSLIVTAEDKIYVVEENKKAKTVGDLYPIKGLVKNIYIESTEDGKRIKAFSEANKNEFLDQWLPLILNDQTKLINEKMYEDKNIFLGIELNNGFTFREVYWLNTNAFKNGAIGNDDIKMIIEEEIASLK